MIYCNKRIKTTTKIKKWKKKKKEIKTKIILKLVAVVSKVEKGLIFQRKNSQLRKLK